MNTSDTRTDGQTDQQGSGKPEQDFQHLKENVTEALGDARQQADAQFGQYRDTAADQIEALAQGAKSFVSEIESKDTLGMSDYLSDMAESMSGLAGNLRGKSAEQLLHDAANLARSNPALFIAGSVALGFGLSRFLKAGSAPAATFPDASDPAAGNSMPPSGGFGAQRPYETSVAPRTDPGAGLATGITPASPNEHDHPSGFATTSTPGSTAFKGEL
ncbi:hypothetical protein PMI27_000438 [Pseudomonas sp. GM41(2012)]|jgi:hypothetical protein|uniref:hypothetical protein n=1 Tax=Pseudomonas sp. (strain GM41(2012)) TaxID=1144708 RepID=UPI00027032DA|nr:hypothetical protein [Pseudomonas sp. GM41(2012)]EUB74262.1 hypothetical protein PMI27_000438 [Pseudomonas sp. GM41(2012)]